MAIQKLTVSNFKGIEEEISFELKPITVYVGGNSSGKSSALHALASLAQTIKLGNSYPALILDDEYAQVHLGRFNEIAHTKKFTTPINLQIDLGKSNLRLNDDFKVEGECSGKYSFVCDKKTEEIFLDAAEVMMGDYCIYFKRSKTDGTYKVTNTKNNKKLKAQRKANFFFQILPPDQPNQNDQTWIFTYFVCDHIQKLIESALRNTLYLGPFRQSPLRRYPFRGSTANEVGAQGEAAVTMLASEYIQSNDKRHLNEINNWLSHLGLAKSIGVSRVGTSDLFDVSMTLNDGNNLPIADLGYGLSQVLPVLTQCSFAPLSSTLLFEQPELHLHEGAARKLAGVFVETAKNKKINMLIETHSKELIYELFGLIKNGTLSIDDIAIYSVERKDGKSVYTQTEMVLENGQLEVSNSNPWFKSLNE